MILAIDIDNSKINFGIFEDDGTLTIKFSITANVAKTSDEYAVLIDNIFNFHKIDRNKINGVSLCSVVPSLTSVIYELIKLFFANAEIIQVQKGVKTGFSIKIDNPTELGADFVAKSVAVIEILKKENISNSSCIIIDVGTVTTIFALNENKEFVGCCIIPGIEMSFNVLHGKTAQLPNVSLISPTKAIGKNSQDAIRSGVIYGTSIMIDGFIEKFSNEMKSKNINVFITGEHSQNLIPLSKHKYRYIPNLTLFGLYCIYKNNTNTW